MHGGEQVADKRIKDLVPTSVVAETDYSIIDGSGKPEAQKITVADARKAFVRSQTDTFIYSGLNTFALSQAPVAVTQVIFIRATSVTSVDASNYMVTGNQLEITSIPGNGDTVVVSYLY